MPNASQDRPDRNNMDIVRDMIKEGRQQERERKAQQAARDKKFSARAARKERRNGKLPSVWDIIFHND